MTYPMSTAANDATVAIEGPARPKGCANGEYGSATVAMPTTPEEINSAVPGLLLKNGRLVRRISIAASSVNVDNTNHPLRSSVSLASKA